MDTKYFARKRMCSNTLQRNELRVYISLKENKLANFANSQRSIDRYAILFMISEKSISRGKFLLRGVRMHQESQQVKQKSCISEFLTLSAIK